MKQAMRASLVIVALATFSCITFWDEKRTVRADYEDFESWYKINSKPLIGDADGLLQGRHLEAEGLREVYINEIGRPVIEGTRDLPFPSGTIIVKDTYYRTEDGERGRRWNITVMRKRETDYDPDNNDWEYLTVNANKTIRIQGKMTLCIDCHAAAEDDYVFTWPE